VGGFVFENWLDFCLKIASKIGLKSGFWLVSNHKTATGSRKLWDVAHRGAPYP